jgi:hypothetical protein
MNIWKNRWSQLPRRQRLFLVALATWICAAWAIISLLRLDGLRDVLYKGF